MKRPILSAFTALALLETARAVGQGAPSPAPQSPAVSPAANASGVADVLRGTVGTDISSDTVVQYDPETDTIILVTDEETNAQIARVIEALDKPAPQVLIKVLFLEVTYSDDIDFGAQAAFTFRAGGNPQELSDNFGLDSLTRGGFFRVVDDNFQATLYALATQGKLEVLSRPSVLARNNEAATITIGQEVPFIRNSRITDNGQTINTVEYEDIGIILDVTPHITPDLMVEMEVSPEISTLTGETVPISDTVNATVIAKRSAETRVSVENGKTIVIGGLMEDQDTSTVSKVPLLGDIPVLGKLFSRTQNSKSKTELLIFLTPYVVTGQEELQSLTGSEKSRLELAPEAFKDAKQEKFFDQLIN